MRFLGSPIRGYTSQALKRLVKTGNRVYFHITILVNRSVQLVARNHKCPKELNNVPCVIWSCIKMHATHEIVNYASRLIIRATSCTLRFYLDARGTDPKNADHVLAEFDAAVRAILRQEAYGKQDC